jgi:UDPglucose--hexose-1-phosphate uridylyltransferase
MTDDQHDHGRRAIPRICHDPVSGRPVFVAPQRGDKPDDRALAARLGSSGDPQEWCPFCAGNESRTPPDLARVPADPTVPWRARIVPNTFPITVPFPRQRGVEEPREAGGIHDVVIESPQHDRSILDIDADAWHDVWSLCRQRLAMAASLNSLGWATVFKNSGPKAGASLEHIHSQIVGIDVVPPAIDAELIAVRRDATTFPRLLESARRDGRVVAERSDLVALVPPAPRQPYETWIMTTCPEPYFHTTSPARVAAVAELTRDIVARLERLAPGCHYNWWLHQAPFPRSLADEWVAASWHWHFEIVPRLSEFAGFEIGTGCHITTRSAEESARMLRDAGC